MLFLSSSLRSTCDLSAVVPWDTLYIDLSQSYYYRPLAIMATDKKEKMEGELTTCDLPIVN